MVLASTLACVQFTRESCGSDDIPRQPPSLGHATVSDAPQAFTKIPVQADGRCLFYCLYLALRASPDELFQWKYILRNDTGIPLCSTRSQLEDIHLA